MQRSISSSWAAAKTNIALLAELERRVDVIVVAGPPAALAAKKVVTKVPVIFAAVGDPVALGLVRDSDQISG
jgi:putative tryptophan/tyrosine transport system substrate-binding protein